MQTISGPFRWQDFGGDLMLVTDHSGAQVVLAPMGHPGYRRALVTRDERGVLVPLTADQPAARFILHACNMHSQLEGALHALLREVDARAGAGGLVGNTPLARAADWARRAIAQNDLDTSRHTITTTTKVQFRISGMPEDEHETAQPTLEITFVYRPNEGPDLFFVSTKLLDSDGLDPDREQYEEWAQVWLDNEGFDAAVALALKERA